MNRLFWPGGAAGSAGLSGGAGRPQLLSHQPPKIISIRRLECLCVGREAYFSD